MTEKNLFIEFHVLRSHAPSNLNRDDMGTPKSALLGDVRRLRISSQCLKRTWRTSAAFLGELAEEQLGVRTELLPALVLEKLGDELDAHAKEGFIELMGSLGKKDKKASDDEEEEEDEAAEVGVEATAAVGPRPTTPHLLYLSKQEITEAATFAKKEAKALAAVFSSNAKGKRKLEPEKVKKLREKLKQHWAETCTRNAVDVALFGRFMTSDELKQVNAAMQVAHAIGTQKLDLEYDYFTAVDDEKGESGAGHLGETEFAQSVLYEYAVCDLAQFRYNLGDDKALAGAAMGAVAQAMALAVPTGKKNGTAPNSPADYIEVVIRRDQPVSLVNAFLKPIRASKDADAMEASISALRTRAEKYRTAYGDDVAARFVLSPVVDVEAKGGEVVASLKDLSKKVAAVVAAAKVPERAS